MKHIKPIQNFINESRRTITDSHTEEFYFSGITQDEMKELENKHILSINKDITLYIRNNDSYYSPGVGRRLSAGEGETKYPIDSPNFMGNCGWKNGGRLIMKTLIKDTSNHKVAGMKKNCVQMRIVSDSIMEESIVAVDPKRGIIYFLEQYEDDTNSKFESKGIKLAYLNFIVGDHF